MTLMEPRMKRAHGKEPLEKSRSIRADAAEPAEMIRCTALQEHCASPSFFWTGALLPFAEPDEGLCDEFEVVGLEVVNGDEAWVPERTHDLFEPTQLAIRHLGGGRSLRVFGAFQRGRHASMRASRFSQFESPWSPKRTRAKFGDFGS